MANIEPQSIRHQSHRHMLRSETKSLHRQLDNSPLIECLQHTQVIPLNYFKALICLRNAYRFLEPTINASEHRLGIKESFRYVNRLPALNKDLDFFKSGNAASILDAHDFSILVELEACSLDKVQHAADQNHFGVLTTNITQAQYWGIRYVLDGSCHGARMLVPKFTAQLSKHNVDALEYWRLLAGLNSRWSFTLKNLELLPAVTAHETLAAAKQTFRCFLISLNQET